MYTDGVEGCGRGKGGERRPAREAGTPDLDEAAAPIVLVILEKEESKLCEVVDEALSTDRCRSESTCA